MRSQHKDRIGIIEWKDRLYAGSKDKSVTICDPRCTRAIIYMVHTQ